MNIFLDVYCPDCGEILLADGVDKYICNQCNSEFEFKLMLVRVPTCTPPSYTAPHEDDP